MCIADQLTVAPPNTLGEPSLPEDGVLPESTIIAIGASIGGAVCLIASLVIIAVCVARRRRRAAAARSNAVDLANFPARNESTRSAHSTHATNDDDIPIAVLGSEYGRFPGDYAAALPSPNEIAPVTKE